MAPGGTASVFFLRIGIRSMLRCNCEQIPAPFTFESVSRAGQIRPIGRNRSFGPKRENPGNEGVAQVMD